MLNIHHIKNKCQHSVRVLGCLFLLFLVNNGFAQKIAFPTAEGYGKYATGGRGGKVFEVANLNASGSGSLGDALNASGARTIVFRVGGTIKGDFNITNGDVTIAGQTAPGDGIEINGSLSINASNVILRYIRVRGNGTGDVITGGHYYKNIIIDHVSSSYSSDEVFSVYWNYDITVQWCMITEACSADHKFGGIWGGERATYHHNLFAHNTDRNPRIASGAGHNDVRNNVLYNWKNEGIYGGEWIQTNDGKKTSGDGCWVNVVANYIKPGPGTPTTFEKHARVCSPWTQKGGVGNYGKWYVADNVLVGHDDVTKDNWKGVFPNDLEGKKTNDQASISSIKLAVPAEFMPINQQTAADAYTDVLAGVGCSFPRRDAVDTRIINEVRIGTATKGDNGFVSNIGQSDGHPSLKNGTAPIDSDHDGMPNDWETANGLKPNDASDGAKYTLNTDYTNLEVYLACVLGELSTCGVATGLSETESVSYQGISVYPNPSRSTFHFSTTHATDLQVIDTKGRLCEEYKNVSTAEFGANLKPGIYYLKIDAKMYELIKE